MSPRPPSRRIAALPVLLVLGGCATFQHGTGDAVSVVTDPPGAIVSSSSGTICISPCRVVGARKEAFSIAVSKPGFQTQNLWSESKPTATLAEASRNEFTADYLGRVIDVQDGSHNEHVPAAFVVKLDPNP